MAIIIKSFYPCKQKDKVIQHSPRNLGSKKINKFKEIQ